MEAREPSGLCTAGTPGTREPPWAEQALGSFAPSLFAPRVRGRTETISAAKHQRSRHSLEILRTGVGRSTHGVVVDQIKAPVVAGYEATGFPIPLEEVAANKAHSSRLAGSSAFLVILVGKIACGRIRELDLRIRPCRIDGRPRDLKANSVEAMQGEHDDVIAPPAALGVLEVVSTVFQERR